MKHTYFCLYFNNNHQLSPNASQLALVASVYVLMYVSAEP